MRSNQRVYFSASPKQYSLTKILLIWAAVTLPMGLAYWVITPALADGPYDTVVLAPAG